MKTTTSNVWPYVLAGSAIGGTIGFLFMTGPGKKIRHALANPDEMADNLDDARVYLERKAKGLTGQIRTVLDKAKEGMAAGQRAFTEAEESYRSFIGKIEGKNNEIASGIHRTVDNLNKTAYTVEQTLLDPFYEMGALYRG